MFECSIIQIRDLHEVFMHSQSIEIASFHRNSGKNAPSTQVLFVNRSHRKNLLSLKCDGTFLPLRFVLRDEDCWPLSEPIESIPLLALKRILRVITTITPTSIISEYKLTIHRMINSSLIGLLLYLTIAAGVALTSVELTPVPCVFTAAILK